MNKGQTTVGVLIVLKAIVFSWKTHGGAAIVNAFYSPNENSIQFPAGILDGVFFQVTTVTSVTSWIQLFVTLSDSLCLYLSLSVSISLHLCLYHSLSVSLYLPLSALFLSLCLSLYLCVFSLAFSLSLLKKSYCMVNFISLRLTDPLTWTTEASAWWLATRSPTDSTTRAVRRTGKVSYSKQLRCWIHSFGSGFSGIRILCKLRCIKTVKKSSLNLWNLCLIFSFNFMELWFGVNYWLTLKIPSDPSYLSLGDISSS